MDFRIDLGDLDPGPYEIQVTLTAQEQARMEQSWSVDPDVLELYLRGRFDTRATPGRAIEYLQQAIQKDRGDAGI